MPLYSGSVTTPGLSLRTGPAPVPAATAPDGSGRVAIIDIGSNSIRLVVYDGPARIPSVLFNEKVMAGLGKSLAATGAIDDTAMARALAGLERFLLVAAQIGVSTLHTVATAAVREASNGGEFVARAEALGLSIRLLSGREEAEMAGEGVVAAFPDADGVVGDLGGGSLELVRIERGAARHMSSFPLGVLRIGAIRRQGPQALRETVRDALAEAGWTGRGAGLPFYLVGGSWRALARLVMWRTGYPLPIVHGYTMPPASAAQTAKSLVGVDKTALKDVPGLSASRAATLPDAAALLAAVSAELGSASLVTSAYGLREGVLYRSLPDDVRGQDPLVCATREEGRRLGRFAEHGDLLDRWTAPLFAGEGPKDARLRHAACLLADVGWRAHPEFRAERGLETALHGNWVGVDARGRAMMAQALWSSFGADGDPPVVPQLCSVDDRRRAVRWGLAMRLGQRLSGGVAAPLRASAVTLEAGSVTLALAPADTALYGEAVERRHRALAAAFGREAVVRA